jgi:hypothetical protein
MKTLKQEEIYCNRYADYSELSDHLEEFIDTYYNRLRLHSALGYRTPEEFEQAAAAAPGYGRTEEAATMKFFTSKDQEKMSAPPDRITPHVDLPFPDEPAREVARRQSSPYTGKLSARPDRYARGIFHRQGEFATIPSPPLRARSCTLY